MIESALLTQMLATSALTNLVGQRIYYSNAPQHVDKPYIVFFKISGKRDQTQTAAMAFCNASIQFSVFAETYTSAKAVAAQIQALFQSYSGTLSSTHINAAFYDNETDFYEQDTQLHHIALDFSFCYEE